MCLTKICRRRKNQVQNVAWVPRMGAGRSKRGCGVSPPSRSDADFWFLTCITENRSQLSSGQANPSGRRKKHVADIARRTSLNDLSSRPYTQTCETDNSSHGFVFRLRWPRGWACKAIALRETWWTNCYKQVWKLTGQSFSECSL